ncbi:unnamed protein product [Calypogeia fissa]
MTSESNFALLANKTLGGNEATVQKRTKAFIARYTEPERHYHTVEHVHARLECLSQSRHLVRDETAMKPSPARSVSRTQSLLVSPATLSGPSRILCAGRRSGLRLVSLPRFDLEVLSRSGAAYAKYAAQIQQEYSHMKLADYCAGRVKVLRSFLGRDRLYFSNVFNESHEEKARANLEQGISSLEAILAGLSRTS